MAVIYIETGDKMLRIWGTFVVLFVSIHLQLLLQKEVFGAKFYAVNGLGNFYNEHFQVALS